MILRVNMEDLRQTTHSRHYELYRRIRLEQIDFDNDSDAPINSSFQETYEARRATHLLEMQTKEDELRQRFMLTVKQKEAQLKEMENQLFSKFDRLEKQSSDQNEKLEIDRQRLDEEIAAFNLKKVTSLGSGGSGSNLPLQQT
jgi:septin 6/8/11